MGKISMSSCYGLQDILSTEKEAKNKRMYTVCYLSCKKEVYEKTYTLPSKRNSGKINQEIMRLFSVRSGWDEMGRMGEGEWDIRDEVGSDTSLNIPFRQP